MKVLPKSLESLIESFRKLPGIGPKSATRLAFYLLHVPQKDLDEFGDRLKTLKTSTTLCSQCKNVTEEDPCDICSYPGRDHSIICIVEQPTDLLSIEKTGRFNGLYHVLHGAINPLNNIGPDELYIADLIKRITHPTTPVQEIIFATNSNMEGEATAMYITQQIRKNNLQCKITRLAHGLPIGADVEYADEVTLMRALEGRREY
jgi:recombination protein RecR